MYKLRDVKKKKIAAKITVLVVQIISVFVKMDIRAQRVLHVNFLNLFQYLVYQYKNTNDSYSCRMPRFKRLLDMS